MRNRGTLMYRPRRMARHMTGRNNDFYEAFKGRDIVVSHKSGEWTIYAAATDTDADRGAALQTANLAYDNGDTGLLGPFTYDAAGAQTGTPNQGYVMPAKTCNVRGCGRDFTEITCSDNTLELFYVEGTSEVADLHFHSIGIEPLLIQGLANATIDRVKCTSTTTAVGLWFNNTGGRATATVRDSVIIGGITFADCDATVERCTFTKTGSSNPCCGTSSTGVTNVTFNDCTFVHDGTSNGHCCSFANGTNTDITFNDCAMEVAAGTGNALRGSLFSGDLDVICNDCTITGSPTTNADGVYCSGPVTSISLYGCEVHGAQRYDLNRVSGTLGVDSATNYDTSNGTITAL